MKEARTITVDTLRPLRRAIGAGVLCRRLRPKIEETVKRGRINTALTTIEDQKKARAGLVDERRREAGASAVASQTERRTAQLNGNR
jgi:hypothetical protein